MAIAVLIGNYEIITSPGGNVALTFNREEVLPLLARLKACDVAHCDGLDVIAGDVRLQFADADRHLGEIHSVTAMNEQGIEWSRKVLAPRVSAVRGSLTGR